MKPDTKTLLRMMRKATRREIEFKAYGMNEFAGLASLERYTLGNMYFTRRRKRKKR